MAAHGSGFLCLFLAQGMSGEKDNLKCQGMCVLSRAEDRG